MITLLNYSHSPLLFAAFLHATHDRKLADATTKPVAYEWPWWRA